MIIILCILGYIFLVVLCFRILEIKKIGFDKYWYPKEGELSQHLYNNKDLMWASSAIWLSIIFPLTFSLLFCSYLVKCLLIKRGFNQEKKGIE